MLDLTCWLPIPCPVQAPVWRELSNLPDCRVRIVCEKDISNARKNLAGWSMPDFGRADVRILPGQDWKSRVDEILNMNTEGVHVFAALARKSGVTYAMKQAFRRGLRTGIVAECPKNLRRGFGRLKKRLETTLYLAAASAVRPQFARRSLFALTISCVGDPVFERLGLSKKQIFPFGYFVDGRTNENEALRESASRTVNLVYAGMLVTYKRVDTLLESCYRLKSKGGDFRCRIIGDGPERADLERLAAARELGENISFLGKLPMPEARSVINDSDIIVLPGPLEGWGVPVNEGILGGLAVVVSDGVGARDLVRISGAGRVFEGANVDSLTDALSSLVINRRVLDIAKACARAYAPKIMPKVVARYVRDVVLHATGERGERPDAPWLSAS